MNREIKFRIWDIENKEMLKVQELDFEPTFYGGRIAIRPDQYSDYFDTEDMILMQYTGLHDKNGKEIYEGDIVAICFQRAIKRGKAVIKYIDKFAGFVLTETGDAEHEYAPIGDYQMKNFEVIGNIYDNPELLGGE